MPLSACKGEKVSSASYEENLAVLEKTCAELTASDTEGRVYEPIVGRYLETESRRADFISSSDSFVHHMVFLTQRGKIALYGRVPSEGYDKHFSDIAKVLGKNPSDSAEDTEVVYGICANNAETGAYYFGNESTLMQLGE